MGYGKGTPACGIGFGQGCAAGAGAVQNDFRHRRRAHHACGDMPKLFAAILRGEGYPCEGYTLHPMGSASLAASEQAEEKAAVAVQNSLNAVAQALEEGLAIQKLHLVATFDADPDRQLEFTLDAGLAVSGLKLPKAEKGAEEEATFLVNADACAAVADMVVGLVSA